MVCTSDKNEHDDGTGDQGMFEYESNETEDTDASHALDNNSLGEEIGRRTQE